MPLCSSKRLNLFTQSEQKPFKHSSGCLFMFKFLKEKLKNAVSKISRKVEEEAPEEIKEDRIIEAPKKERKKIPKKEKIIEQEPERIIEEAKEQQDKKGFFGKLKEKFVHEEKEEAPVPVEELEKPLEEKEKKSFFGKLKEKVTTTKISEAKFNELFEDLELVLLENNVAFEVVEKIKEDLKKDIVEKPIKRGEVENEIKNSLKESIEDLFLVPKINLIEKIKEKGEKPFIICFVGQNGSGKTTSISKIAHLLKRNKLSVVLAASDTFRAASIEQLKEWGNKLNVKVIAHDYKSDPAAVSFDAIKYAQSHNIDVVLIDTAGRQHSNKDLMRELEKVIRVAKPDLKIFVGEAITGGDCIEQAKEFHEAIGIDGIILAKADVDEKGGAMVSVSYVVHRPIVYLGTGQNPDDLKEFDKEEIIKQLGLN